MSSAPAASSLNPTLKAHARIAEIGREAWDACVAASSDPHNPFISFDFLDACEEAGCAVERTGWGPRHLTVEDAAGRIAGVMPLYLKSHSQGEYVFDHGWAEAYERAGGRYYPKLQSRRAVLAGDRPAPAGAGDRRRTRRRCCSAAP